MPLALWSLLGFVLWTIGLLLAGVGFPRIRAVKRGESRPSEFRADVPHGSERYRRTVRAHLNCVENLPIFAALVLMASVIGLRSVPFDGLAIAVLPLRLAQSITHVISGSSRAVLVRFTFFLLQLACVLAMAGLIAAHALGRS